MEVIYYDKKMVIPVMERDNEFIKIQNLIDAKRQLLIKKQKKLKLISRQNKFLEAVKNDYSKYYNYIAEQKRDQIKALEALDEYIKDLTLSGKLTKYNIQDAKEEQFKILNEVKSIKESLDTIVDNTTNYDDILNKKK